MGSVEWVLFVGFFSIGFGLYLIHKELVALRMDFRQISDLFASRLLK